MSQAGGFQKFYEQYEPLAGEDIRATAVKMISAAGEYPVVCRFGDETLIATNDTKPQEIFEQYRIALHRKDEMRALEGLQASLSDIYRLLLELSMRGTGEKQA